MRIPHLARRRWNTNEREDDTMFANFGEPKNQARRFKRIATILKLLGRYKL